MKKFLNSVDTVLQESLAGFAAAHEDLLALDSSGKFVQRKSLKPGKVALISGGGTGHEPLHGGFVGFGMLDAACPGQVFTSPTPDQMMEAASAVDTGAGCLFIVKNYEGDVMNFDVGAEMSEAGKPLGKERWAGVVDCVGSHTLANACATTKYNGTVAACGLAQGFDLPATVMPFILRGVTLAGVDSVSAPTPVRQEAWDKLAATLKPEVFEAVVEKIALSDAIETAGKLLKGQVRGRVVVDVNA